MTRICYTVYDSVRDSCHKFFISIRNENTSDVGLPCLYLFRCRMTTKSVHCSSTRKVNFQWMYLLYWNKRGRSQMKYMRIRMYRNVWLHKLGEDYLYSPIFLNFIIYDRSNDILRSTRLPIPLVVCHFVPQLDIVTSLRYRRNRFYMKDFTYYSWSNYRVSHPWYPWIFSFVMKDFHTRNMSRSFLPNVYLPISSI